VLRLRKSSAPFAAAISIALGVSACGGDDGDADSAKRPRTAAPANVNLAEAQSYLERGDVAIVRDARAGGAALADELDPAPAESARLTSQRGPGFALLVYATPKLARTSWESVLATDAVQSGASVIRAVNLIAVFRERADGAFHTLVARRLRRLAKACADPTGDPKLRALCYEPHADPVPPPGPGTQVDELAPVGAEVVVGDIRYSVALARQLNPHEPPDEAIVGDRRPEGGDLLLGVFLRACNASGDAPARTTERITLVGPFGAEERPITLAAENPFAYDATRLAGGDCVPRPGSVADSTTGGMAVVFRITPERLQERPLGLRIVGPTGSDRAVVQLDV
jgi:hypothetical protein